MADMCMTHTLILMLILQTGDMHYPHGSSPKLCAIRMPLYIRMAAMRAAHGWSISTHGGRTIGPGIGIQSVSIP